MGEGAKRLPETTAAPAAGERMPSRTSNPDHALFDRFKAMERRLQALETRRG